MPHNVTIKKTPVLSKDRTRVLKGKYTYQVACKQCGDVHPEGKFSSEGLAALAAANHHIEMRERHRAAHPGDTRHKSGPTNKMVQRKMVKLRA